MLANRLSPKLETLIQRNQSAFIKGEIYPIQLQTRAMCSKALEEAENTQDPSEA
jgi:hypothetical protein